MQQVVVSAAISGLAVGGLWLSDVGVSIREERIQQFEINASQRFTREQTNAAVAQLRARGTQAPKAGSSDRFDEFWLWQALEQMDVFTIWWLLVVALGLSALVHVRWRRVAIAMCSMYVMMLAIGAFGHRGEANGDAREEVVRWH